MPVLHGFEGWPREAMHVAIGVFDGVHLGHQAVIAELRVKADAAGATAIAATFDPLPIEVLAPGAPPSALSDARERVELLERAGARAVVVFRSEPSFFALTAADFADRLARAGKVHRIVVGPDFRFGHDRQGDVALLSELGRTRGWTVEIVPPVEKASAVISSTRIRNLLLSGDVRGAAGLLGRTYALPGRVVHGDKRGRALGFPTINVATPRERLLPRDGIYATRVTLGTKTYAAATSLGVRPTFGGSERVLESYLLDVGGDLYGEDVVVAFVERLRDELRFESAEALIEQIARDVEATRRAL